METPDPRYCLSCGAAIYDKRPAQSIADLGYGTVTGFYHPACFEARSPGEHLAGLAQLAAEMIATLTEPQASSAEATYSLN